jgi:nitric oxide reductase activation protein
MLEVASRKLGLETVVMGKAESPLNDEDTALKAKEIDRLLKYGAYHLFNSNEEEEEAKEMKMLNEDIESILKRSATVKFDGNQEDENGDSDEGKAANQRAKAAAAMKVSYPPVCVCSLLFSLFLSKLFTL